MSTPHPMILSDRWTAPGLLALALLFAFTLGPATGGADDKPKTTIKAERFDRDPGWEALNNHVEPKRIPTVTQDFGYSATTFASKAKGEIGGRITRANRPAYYADRI